jgi:hypothetical protein
VRRSMVMRSRARREECVQMPGKMARSAPRPPFGLPDAPVAVRTSRLSCGKAGKARISKPVPGSSGESRFSRLVATLVDGPFGNCSTIGAFADRATSIAAVNRRARGAATGSRRSSPYIFRPITKTN